MVAVISTLISLFILIAIWLAAFGLGRPLLFGLGLVPSHRIDRLLWSLALGLVGAGCLLTVLGLCGWLYPQIIAALTIWGCLEAGRCVWTSWKQPASDAVIFSHEETTPELPQAPRWLMVMLGVLAGISCLAALVVALAPPTAGDALCYHLELPKTFLAQRQLTNLTYQEESTYPLLTEMWFAWGLALDGPVAAQLMHWALGLLLAGGAFLLAEPLVGRRWAAAAAAVVMLTPGINNQMTAPLNDVALAAFTTLALAAWLRSVLHGELRWSLLAGVMAGAALGIKFTALVFAASMLGPWLWLWVKQKSQRPELLRSSALVLVVSLSVGGGWYLRNAWHHGNPVYPYLEAALGDSSGPPVDRSEKRPLGWNVAHLATFPWQVTMQPHKFGGRGHQLGALFLAVAGGLLIARRLRGLGLLLGIAAGYTVLWYALRQNHRFLYPIVPLMAVAVVWVWCELARFRPAPRWAAQGLLLAFCASSTAISLAHTRGEWAVCCGWETRASYLSHHEPTYAISLDAHRLLPANALVLSQEQRAFYFQRPMVRESVFRRKTNYHQDHNSPVEFARYLRAEGFTHVLVVEAQAWGGIRYQPVLSKIVNQQGGLSTQPFVCLAERYYTTREQVPLRYRLMLIAPPSETTILAARK